MLGEPGFETDTRKIKIGNGVSKWNILPYINFGGEDIKIEKWVDKEIPSGDVDGDNSEFILANVHVPGSEHVYLNGQLQDVDGDYSIESDTITFFFPPPNGSKIRVSYRVQPD
jgi:hypothetical protein